MEIYEALKNDHDKVRLLLQELTSLDKDSKDRKSSLIQEIRDELIPHARAEESVFYNSLRGIDAAKDIVMEGYGEHMEIEGFLRTLQGADVIDAGWKKTAQKLADSVEHHVQEEEGRIFNVARQLFTQEEAEMMAVAFEKLKPEVREEGFVQNTLDMVANLMPPRLAASLRSFSLNPRI